MERSSDKARFSDMITGFVYVHFILDNIYEMSLLIVDELSFLYFLKV